MYIETWDEAYKCGVFFVLFYAFLTEKRSWIFASRMWDSSNTMSWVVGSLRRLVYQVIVARFAYDRWTRFYSERYLKLKGFGLVFNDDFVLSEYEKWRQPFCLRYFNGERSFVQVSVVRYFSVIYTHGSYYMLWTTIYIYVFVMFILTTTKMYVKYKRCSRQSVASNVDRSSLRHNDKMSNI